MKRLKEEIEIKVYSIEKTIREIRDALHVQTCEMNLTEVSEALATIEAGVVKIERLLEKG